MRSTHPSTLVLYQVCNSENGGPFNPVGATMTGDKQEALAELQEMRQLDPKVYLSRITYTRVPEARKGVRRAPKESHA